MKKTLLIAPSNAILIQKTTLLQLLFWVSILLFGSLQKATAQCNGPYQVFESVKNDAAAMTAAGWILSPNFDVFNDLGAGLNRTGVYGLSNGNAIPLPGDYVETPTIATPLTFSAYIKGINGGTYDLQVSDDGGSNWDSLLLNSNQLNYDVSAPILLLTPGNWELVTVTFGNSPLTGYSNSNIKFRIVDVNGDILLIDDISWTSKIAADNTTVIPILDNTYGGTPTSCSTSMATGDIFTLYDNGGVSDNYAYYQDNTITFTALSPTDKIEITFNGFKSVLNEDFIYVHNAATAVGNNMITGNVTGFSGTSLPGTITYSSTGASMTIRFTSDAFPSTTNEGYDITVKCLGCAAPSALAFASTGGVSHENAFLTWTGTAPNYDIYYDTTGTVPNAGTTALATSASTSATINGLAASTLYYFWLRSDCGVGGKSTWFGPISSTTLCTPKTVPYQEPFNGLLTGTIPACSFRTSTSWGANNANGNLSCNGVGDSFFSQGVTLTAGQLYRLTYDYYTNGNGNATFEVYYGSPTGNTAPTVANINTLLFSNSAITGQTSATNIVNFTAGSSGTFYIRFKLTGLIPLSALNLDNVELSIENCLPPTFPGSPVSGVDDFGATIAWNVPLTGVPSNGYYYYLSTSASPPNYIDTETGSVASTGITLTSLSPNTTYYYWVRSNCGGRVSGWSSTYASFTTSNITAPTVVRISNLTSPYSVVCGANITFTDSGGTAGDYQINERTGNPTFDPYSFTFTPTTLGSKLMVVFNSFSTENNYDGLTIYSGTSSAGTLMSSGRPAATGLAGSTCIAGAFSGTGAARSPGTILSTAADGSLTFQFRSDYLINSSGWTASIICVSSPPTITSFTPSDNSCGAASVAVVITGTNFSGITGVTFNGVAATYVVNSATQITATLPASATTGKIKVLTATLSATSTTDFTVNKPAPVTTGVAICVGGTGTISSSTACDAWVPVLSISGSLTTSSLTAAKFISSGPACGFSAATNYYYSSIQFMVSVTGAYTLTTTSTPSRDLMGYITTGPFIAGSCATGTYILGNDDGPSGLQPLLALNLTAGVVYTLFTTTYVSNTEAPSYTWTFTTPIGGNILTYQAGTMDWYTSAVSMIPIFSGATFNPVGVGGSGITNTLSPGTWNYWAACSANKSCRTLTTFVIGTATGGTASSSQTICGGSFADLTLSGSSGTVTKWQYADDNLFTSNLTDVPSSASTTLTSAQIGSFIGTRYYRAEVTIVSCGTTYSTAVTLSYNKAIWNGVWSNGTGPTNSIAAEFQADYTSAGNLNACSVLVSAGNVIFNVGHTLTVQNEVKVTGGTLTFANQSSLYQVLNVANAPGVYSGGNSGNITYNRTTTPLFRFDYTYWSSPVFPQNLLAVSPLSPQNLFYLYNSSIPDWQYVNPVTTDMVVGKGYILRAPSSYPPGLPDLTLAQPYTASFIGVPNNGTLTTPIVGGQLNLIGNPYPSALSASSFILDPANTNLNGTIYLWTHNTPITANNYTGSDYAVYNLVGGTAASPNPGASTANLTIPLGYIASGQGFFIKGFSTGTASFKNSMRTAGNNSQFYRLSPYATTTESEFEKHRYWLNITNTEGAFKQVLVGYVETATMGVDRLFDGELVDLGNIITLYTIVENTKLSIQGRPLPFVVEDTVPLGYKSTIAGTYSISLADFDGLFTSQHVYIEDKLLNSIHDLRVAPYSFATEIGSFEDRFLLRYTDVALGTNDPVFTENSVIVYSNDQGLHINTGAITMATVTIFDIRGRVLATQKRVNSTATVFTTLPTTNEVLLVRIEAENGAIVTKKVVY